eukprot:gene12855-17891_t
MQEKEQRKKERVKERKNRRHERALEQGSLPASTYRLEREQALAEESRKAHRVIYEAVAF